MKRLRPVPSLLAVVVPTFTVILILLSLSRLTDLSRPEAVSAEPRATIPPPTATTTPTTSTLYLPTVLNNAWVGQRPAVPWGLQYDPYHGAHAGALCPGDFAGAWSGARSGLPCRPHAPLLDRC